MRGHATGALLDELIYAGVSPENRRVNLLPRNTKPADGCWYGPWFRVWSHMGVQWLREWRLGSVEAMQPGPWIKQ